MCSGPGRAPQLQSDHAGSFDENVPRVPIDVAAVLAVGAARG
ncbi:hypothetical protein [Caballeronia insecticola]|uniref:Uncharacterized protein n=1 Tax=Caballeronia insecticola TaxID=758793 RepID=R4WY45_9BURK|nr:hypothetical protein [Caballeronia insecticola]BAN24121.1 hypothetical protein BRPE64_ACDS23670 [Caballeronia insecticola]